jgi:CRISPR-associated protein Cst2
MLTLKDAKALTITFLTPVSIGSLNGSDKEADNVSSIKKLTRGAKTYPYVSSQALRSPSGRWTLCMARERRPGS